jgi:hypothetical protein
VLSGWPQWATLCAHLLSSRVDIVLILGWLIPSEMVTGPTCNYSLSYLVCQTSAALVTPVQQEIASTMCSMLWMQTAGLTMGGMQQSLTSQTRTNARNQLSMKQAAHTVLHVLRTAACSEQSMVQHGEVCLAEDPWQCSSSLGSWIVGRCRQRLTSARWGWQ